MIDIFISASKCNDYSRTVFRQKDNTEVHYPSRNCNRFLWVGSFIHKKGGGKEQANVFHCGKKLRGT